MVGILLLNFFEHKVIKHQGLKVLVKIIQEFKTIPDYTATAILQYQ